MNLLRLSSLFLGPALLASLAFACGGITDPNKNGEVTATVSGALTGTSVPANARVAIVWRNGQSGGRVVGSEAAVVNGQFSMSLAQPPDAYFFAAETSDYDSLNGGSGNVPNTSPPPTPVSDDTGTDPGGGTGSTSSSTGGAKVQQKMGTRTNVSGGITEPLSVAVAGFVVYVDANGNGKLDLDGEYSSSPDTILGGNKELLLTFLKGGGQLDYEKLRDKSGILPVSGYNLAWTEGRWLPLTLVELKLTESTKLPGPVCNSYGGSFGSGGSGGVATEETAPAVPRDPDTTTPAPAGGYPPKGDPNVHCYDSGRSYYYTGDCPPPPPPPVGLCASGYSEPYACASPSYSFAGDTPPSGWPCDYTGSGSSSSGSSGTPIDGGAMDAGSAPDAGGS